MRVLFFVNGTRHSAAAERAAEFSRRLPADWAKGACYRPSPKWKGLASFTREARRFRPDVVYVMDTAYTGVLAGSLAKRLFGCRLVTDTGDAAYELAKSVGTYSTSQLALIRWVERTALRRSDAVVVRGSYHRTMLLEQRVRDVRFVPDGVDLQAIRPLNARSLGAELASQEGLVVGLVGSMVWSERYRTCYGWDIVEALAHLRDVDVRAVLVGDGDGRIRLEQRARELGVENRVVFAGRQPMDELPKWISSLDVCVSTQSNDVVGQVRTTGKLPLYLACGRYVAATDVGEARRVLPGIGGLLPYEGVRDDAHPARLAAHLHGLLENPQRLRVSEAARGAAQQHFDYDKLADRVRRVCLAELAELAESD